MKGIFTLLFALTLSVAVNAQTRILKADGSSALERDSKLMLVSPSNTAKRIAPKRKIEVGEGERLMGFYTGDDLLYSLAMVSTGTYMVANNFDGEVISNFVGGQIMRFRFALGYATTVYDAYIYTVDSNGYLSSQPVAYVSFGDGAGETLPAGWNDVELPEPITIEEGYGYLIGYTYQQTTYNDYTGAGYSLSVDYMLEQDVERDYFYYSSGSGWSIGNGMGALCIQAVVKGGNFIDYDLTLRNLSVDKYASQGNDISYSYQIKSNGNYYPESYNLKVELDGSELETLTTPISVTSSYQTVSGKISTSDLSVGSHTLSVSVATINGEVPTEGTSDDELSASFVIYEGEAAERQLHLIENFTSTYCMWCPLGDALIEALQEAYPDKYVRVAIHSIGQGADPYALNSSDYLNIEYFVEDYYVGWPSASFDRAELYSTILGLSGDVCSSIGYYGSDVPIAVEAFNSAVDAAFEGVPAFASVDIIPEYNSDTRELKITVKGSGNEWSKTILDGNLLTVYITENGIEGTQYTGNVNTGLATWQNATHNDVLRAIPTTYDWGDDINWTSDSSYENSITTTLDSSWDDSRIYITAFISGPMVVQVNGTWDWGEISDAMVNNANQVKLTDVPEGISAVTVNTDDVTHTYYTTDGRLLSAPVKGVNILKSSDGTVKKIYVK